MHKYDSEWASKHYIHAKALKKVREVRSQLVDIMKSLKLDIDSSGMDWDVVRKVICSSYFHNACRMKGIGEYVNLRTGIPCVLHPTSSIIALGFSPDYVVYHELIMTSKEYMQCVTAADPLWLAELAPTFFTAKRMGENSLNNSAASGCGGGPIPLLKSEIERAEREKMEHEMQAEQQRRQTELVKRDENLAQSRNQGRF